MVKRIPLLFCAIVLLGFIADGQAAPKTINDSGEKTFAAGCARAGSRTLVVTRAWKLPESATYSCNLLFQGAGALEIPASQKIVLSGTVSAPPSKIFDISGGTLILKGVKSISVNWFGVKGDSLTENGTALESAITTAMNSDKPLHWPAGTYLGCSSTITNSGSLTMYGDGMLETIYRRHPSCQRNSAKSMITVTNASSITIQNMGFDMVTGGAEVFSGTIFNVANAGRLTVDKTYWANAQVVGLQCEQCQNGTVTNSIFDKDWWFGISFASGGTTKDPVYGHNFDIHGNTFRDTPIGVGLSFFLSNISVTDNIFDRSNLSLIQMPHAQATIEGNTFNGVPDTGCVLKAQCGDIRSYNAIFLEGVSDWTIGSNRISNFNGQQAAMICLGTTLQIPEPSGTVLKLPCSNGHIKGLDISNSNSGYSILIAGSRDGVYGTDISVQNTTVTAVNQCPIVGGVVGADVSNNSCTNAANGGYTLNDVRNSSFRSNQCHNCNTTGHGGTRPGLVITGKGSQGLDIFNNVFVNDNGNSLSFAIQDATGVTDGSNEIRHGSNTCSEGCKGGLYSPAPVVPLAGNWSVGAIVGDVAPSGSNPTGWVNVEAGVPGKWTCLGCNPSTGK